MRHLGHFVCIYGAVVDGYSSLMTNTIRQINMSERERKGKWTSVGGIGDAEGVPELFCSAHSNRQVLYTL